MLPIARNILLLVGAISLAFAAGNASGLYFYPRLFGEITQAAGHDQTAAKGHAHGKSTKAKDSTHGKHNHGKQSHDKHSHDKHSHDKHSHDKHSHDEQGHADHNHSHPP